MYVRNQRLKAPQETQRLDAGGSGPRSDAHPHGDAVWVILWPVYVAGREATAKACGVAVAMLQGHSWTPTLSNGWKPSVGTIPPVPHRSVFHRLVGEVRCRLMPLGWGGGPEVSGPRPGKPGRMAKGSSVFAADVLITEVAGEYRRAVARPG